MSNQADFDDQFDVDGAAKLERLYSSSADILRRRRLVSQAVAAAPAERLLDVGCGPGFYVAELADRVGDSGHVTGVDSSQPMLAMAAQRTEGRSNVTLLNGEATDLPVADGSVDAALSVQVYEYIDDIGGALGEMFRVLRPGGRLVVWDVDWSTVSWYSAEADRMARVLRVWDEHLSDPALPQRLAAEMSDAGFVDVQAEGHAFVNTDAGSDAYSGAILPLVEAFVAEHGVTVEDATGWRSELEALSAANRYFFAVIQFCFSATRPQ